MYQTTSAASSRGVDGVGQRSLGILETDTDNCFCRPPPEAFRTQNKPGLDRKNNEGQLLDQTNRRSLDRHLTRTTASTSLLVSLYMICAADTH